MRTVYSSASTLRPGAGRLVVLAELRDRFGITGRTRGDIREDGSGIRLELLASDNLVEVDGYLLIGSRDGAALTDDDVRELATRDRRALRTYQPPGADVLVLG